MLQEIFVTNKNDFHHSDRFNGIDYDFPPNERVLIPVIAAEHMFGFNQRDKTTVLQRLGWAMKYDPEKKSFTENMDGVRQLAKFVFTKGVMVEESVDSTLEIPTLT